MMTCFILEFESCERLLDGRPNTAQHKSYTDFMDFITLDKKWLEIVDSTAVVPYLWEQDVLE